MSDSHFSDMKMISDHFPDAVDVQRVDLMDFTEVIYQAPTKYLYKARSEEEVKIVPKEIRTVIDMKELEPETGIFAGMSPVTHRVYVYISPEGQL